MKTVLLILVLLGLVGAGVAAWLAFLPNTPAAEEPYSVRVPEGTSFEGLLDSLESVGAVRSRTSLSALGNVTGWDEQVKTGHYYLEPGMTNWAVLDKIRKGLQDPIRITIPPGSRPERTARVLRNQLGTDSAAVARLLRDPAFADSMGTNVAHLHGQMLAETFDMYWTDDAETALRRIHERYDRFWTPERRAKAEALGLTPDEVVTLASIVEWEARKPEERRRIAGVYVNRLLGRTSAGRMRLQADPTVQFALMEEGGEPRMRRLLFRDYAYPSDYNTYRIDGLPPGPITNPADGTIDAVLDNEAHDYLFFVADGSGGHDFSRTVSEHNAKARRWSQWLSEQVRQKRAAEAAGAAP
ncbi:endolytic transglycosylase MltG [Rubrivirga litoralis]|uniref:Endolytic murein transglycosylase n=1 Tax=Rubrivirga litoralis TaxID=3075598 RepID=A0ABU3BTK8_9BACT|nr:endolytic transglycosylase MltG [Rubrivirga sp. F394]MDT0632617.1 endolytic transglycosylase MltG [Rubrivirga sp. F394]